MLFITKIPARGKRCEVRRATSHNRSAPLRSRDLSCCYGHRRGNGGHASRTWNNRVRLLRFARAGDLTRKTQIYKMDGCVENIDPDTMTRVSLVSGDQLLMTGRNWEFASKDYDLSGMDQPIRRTGFHQWCGRGPRRCSPCRNHAWRGPTRHRTIAPG